MNAPCRNAAGAIICDAAMLPAEQRLRANRDFRLIYSRGRSHASPVAVLYVMRRMGDYALAAPGRRFGFVVSKKQGGAVARNRIKRRLREAVRERLPELRDGPFDVIIVGRSRAQTAGWIEIQEAVEDLLRRGSMLRGAHDQNERDRNDGDTGEPVR
jgi:ribonuclease P protein component